MARQEIRIASTAPLNARARRDVMRQIKAAGPRAAGGVIALPTTRQITGRAVVSRPQPMAGGGTVPDIDFEVLNDYLRGVFEALLQNMANVLPWPIKALVEELLDVGRAPTFAEFEKVLNAIT